MINVDQLKKGRKGGLLWRVRVWSMGGSVGREEINFTIAKSHGFLYWKAREATEIVIRRCELFPSLSRRQHLIYGEGSNYWWQWEFIYFNDREHVNLIMLLLMCLFNDRAHAINFCRQMLLLMCLFDDRARANSFHTSRQLI